MAKLNGEERWALFKNTLDKTIEAVTSRLDELEDERPLKILLTVSKQSFEEVKNIVEQIEALDVE